MGYDEFKDLYRNAWKYDGCVFIYSAGSKKRNEKKLSIRNLKIPNMIIECTP